MNRLVFCVLISLAAAGSAVAQGPQEGEWRFHTQAMQRNRDLLLSREYQQVLPRLGTDFWMITPPSLRYNTFSYAVGFRNQCIWIQPGPMENPFVQLDPLMAKDNYRRLSEVDTTLQAGVEKVIVFGKPIPSGEVELTVAVVQHADGSFTAKLGLHGVIGFTRLDQLTSPVMGIPLAVYARETAEQRASD